MRSFARVRLSNLIMWLAAGLASSAAGCGGDPGGGAACSGAACGGTIVGGNYTITASCFGATTVKEASCAVPVTVDLHGIFMTGGGSLNDDHTYRLSTTVSGSLVETIPAQCLNLKGRQVTCQEVTQELQAMVTKPGSPFRAFTCSGSGDCICTAVSKPRSQSQQGTYATSGTNVTFTPANGESPSVDPYCASPTQIIIQYPMSSMTGMAALEGFSGSIVLTKQ